MHRTNHQDMVFILPNGLSNGVLQLRMDNIWFCKLLLLFKISTMTGVGMQEHKCAFVSVLDGVQRTTEIRPYFAFFAFFAFFA